jgi:hypothetical protein
MFEKFTKFFLFLIAATFVFNSCTVFKGYSPYQYVNVKLDAISSGENVANKKVALMVCNNDNIPKNDLKNMELEGYIKKALVPKGYTFTDNNEDANIVIFYEYGITDPRYYTSEKIVPIWGVTGISSSVTTTIRQRTPITNRPYTQQYTYNTPSYGKVGERVVTETKIKYLCWANITAYDADYYRKTGEDKMIWLTEIQSENENDNLRFVFPFMITAAREYIGQSRSNRIEVDFSANPVDSKVLDFKGTAVIIRLNEATKGKKDPQATVYQDTYRNGELIIRAGTPVKMALRKGKMLFAEDGFYGKRSNPTLELYNFSTTSIYGSKISLNGTYRFAGEFKDGVYKAGLWLTACCIFPVSIPMLCATKKYPKIPTGTYLWLEID